LLKYHEPYLFLILPKFLFQPRLLFLAYKYETPCLFYNFCRPLENNRSSWSHDKQRKTRLHFQADDNLHLFLLGLIQVDKEILIPWFLLKIQGY